MIDRMKRIIKSVALFYGLVSPVLFVVFFRDVAVCGS